MCDLTVTRTGRERSWSSRAARSAGTTSRGCAATCPADGCVRSTTRPPGSAASASGGRARATLVAVAVRGRPVERGVPVHDRAGPPHRLRAGAGLRISYVGELGWEIYAPTEFGLAAVGHAVAGGRAARRGRVRRRRVRRAAPREGLPPLGPGHRRGARPVRGRPRLARAAQQGRRLHRPRGGRARSRSAASGAGCAAWSPTTRRACSSARRRCSTATRRSATSRAPATARRVGESILYGYLPVSHAEPGTRLSVWSEGAAHPVTVSTEPLFDPANERMKDVAAPRRLARSSAGARPGPASAPARACTSGDRAPRPSPRARTATSDGGVIATARSPPRAAPRARCSPRGVQRSSASPRTSHGSRRAGRTRRRAGRRSGLVPALRARSAVRRSPCRRGRSRRRRARRRGARARARRSGRSPRAGTARTAGARRRTRSPRRGRTAR